MTIELSLLDFLAARLQCEFLSDLRFLKRGQAVRLLREVEKIPSDSAALHEWNDALQFLADAAPEKDADAARQRLIACLTESVFAEQSCPQK